MKKDNGWIKLHRNLISWEWYSDHNTTRLFIHMLMKSSHKPIKWQGIDIDQGSFVTGRSKLSEETGISEQSIRTSIARLISTGEITSKKTNRYSIISVCNWNDYQDTNQPTNQQSTSNQPTTNHIQEVKKVKNGKTYTDDFELFWKVYPNKTGKGAAFNSWNKMKSKPCVEVIVEKINALSSTEQWTKSGGQFIPLPTTWLNQSRWDDEVQPQFAQMEKIELC